MRLHEGTIAHGTVRDAASGLPIANARVSLDFGASVSDLNRTTHTDSYGRFELLGPEAPFSVACSAAGYGRFTDFVLDQKAGVDFYLTPCMAVTGRFTDSEGQGLIVDIECLGRHVPYPTPEQLRLVGFRAQVESVRTVGDGDGRFRIEVRPDVPVTLVARCLGFERVLFDLPMDDGLEVLDLGTIVLGEESVVEGIVVDVRGAAITGARITVMRIATATLPMRRDLIRRKDTFVGSRTRP